MKSHDGEQLSQKHLGTFLYLPMLSVSALRGPVFRRYLFNGEIDQNETWAQGVSAFDLIFFIICSYNKKMKILGPSHWLLMLQIATWRKKPPLRRT